MNHFKKYDRDARKELSQNYIKNPALVRLLHGYTSFGKGDLVVDIGAGEGALSEVLVSHGYMVQAIEKDESNVEYLQSRFNSDKNFTVFHQDALFYHKPKEGVYHVFSNPPFSITSKLVKYFFLKKPFPNSGYMVMQREAAERLMGENSPSLVGVLLQTLYKIEVVHHFK